MNQKDIVKDKNGEYQSAYNLALGKEKALNWAIQCANNVLGTVYLLDEETNQETEVYRVQ